VTVTITGKSLPADPQVQVATSSTASDQAQAGSDYNATDKTLTFARDTVGTAQKKSVPIPILDDVDPEPDETFTVTLSATGATVKSPPAQIKIEDNDCVRLSLPASLSLVEGEPATRFDVNLPRQPESDVELQFGFAYDSPSDEPDVNVTVQPEEAFYPLDHWDRSRTVKAAAENDALCNESPRTFTITVTAVSEDPLFSCIEQTIPGEVVSDGDPCVNAEARARVCSDDGETIRYTVEVENTGGVRLENLPGPEIRKQLAPEVTVVTASANRGVATVDYVENEFAWNGSILVGETAIIQILATLEPDAAPGDEVDFAGVYKYDGREAPFGASFTVGQAAPCSSP
jgi:uncharacterized repeat protein (TIGR01451 family)